MRIVHTCLRYPPATGGVETYVRAIVERTRDIDQERDVRVLTSTMRTHGPISELDPELLRDDPPYVQRLHYARTPLISYPRLQALKYYLGHHAPDIIHGYSFWYQPADVAARYATKHSLPFIFHPIYYENNIRRKPTWQLYKKTIGQRTFAAADVVVVISPYEQSLIEQAGFPVKRFELIPPGLDLADYATPHQNPFLTSNIKGSILLTVSRLAPGKGLDELIAALPAIKKQIPDVQLAIVGEDFGAKATLIQQAKQLGIAEYVHFLGRLSDHALKGAFQHADLFIHPSYYEAFGIVLAESLASGTPIVARNTTAIPYVAPHNTAGLLFSSQPELTAHVIELLQNDNRREELARQGLQHVSQNFTWNRSIKKLAVLYDEFVLTEHLQY